MVIHLWASAARGWPETSDSGEIAVEGRAFVQDDRNPETAETNVALFGRVEVASKQEPFSERLRGYGRYDAADGGRSLLALEEAWFQVEAESLRVRIGFDIVNWSATEAFHPADVLNARNWNSDIESFEKLGEPMLQLHVRVLPELKLAAFFMPYFTHPRLTSARSPLHFGPPGVAWPELALVDRDGQTTRSRFGPQVALATRVSLGSADVTAHVLEHMDRTQPWISSRADRTVFQTVRQVGATYQQVLGPVILKAEAAYRTFVQPSPTAQRELGALPSRDHAIGAVGLEYIIPHSHGGEGSLLVEAQSVMGPREQWVRRSLSPFPQHLLVGYRTAFNDESNRQLLIGVIADWEWLFSWVGGPAWLELAGNASYEQRLGDTWTLAASARLFVTAGPAPEGPRFGLQTLTRADHVRLTATRHF